MTDIATLGIKVDASSADSAGSALDRLRTRAKGAELAVGAMRAAFAGVAAAGAAFAAVVGKVTTVQREFDVLNSSLITVTGSAQAAERNFAWIRKFAAETPYSLNEVTGAFVKLKALGLDASRDALESYGNTASAMGKSLDQFIEAVADASTGEFERLKEFGIKARQDGATVAFTFRGITTTVRNSADEIESYLRRIGNVDFAGAMDIRAKTLDGALSNLGDTWDELFRTISSQGVGQIILDGVRAAERGVRRLIDALNDMSIAAKSGQDFLTFLGRGTGLETLDEDLSGNVQKITEINKKLIDLQKNGGGGISSTFNQRRIDALKRERAELEAEGKILEREAERRRKLRAPVTGGDSESRGTRTPSATAPSKSELAALRRAAEEEQKLRLLAAEQVLGTDDAQLKFNADVARAYEEFDRRRKAANDEAIRQANQQEDAVSRLVERYRDLADPTRQYRQEIELVTVLEAQGRLSAEEAFNARGKLIEQEQSAAQKTSESLKKQKSLAEELGLTFTSAFEDAVVSGKKLGDVLNGLAQDILRVVVRKSVTEPLGESIAAFAKELFPSARGNAFAGAGQVQTFASGGAFGNGEVLTRPTLFRFASGGSFREGVAGEAGPEAAVPLKRMSNGKLGVYAEGGGQPILNVRVINNAQAQVSVAQNDSGDLELVIDQVDFAIGERVLSGRGGTFSAMQNRFGLRTDSGGY
jgi:hypothetical protein